MRRQILDAVIIGSAIGLGASALFAQGFAPRGTVRANQAGGPVRRAVGPSSGTAIAARRLTADGHGTTAGGGGAAFTGAGGATGTRAGAWSRSADGGAQHHSAAAIRSPDGSVDGSRTTTAAADSGATYGGQTTYEKSSGLIHTTTCTSAAGAVVSCRQ